MNPDAYRFYSKIYDKVYEPAAKRLRFMGIKIFPPQENLAVLDVGCGTGTQLALYQKAGCKLYGIDLSPSMLAAARQKLGDSADLRLEDASKMSFAAATFDLVTIVLALHEMPAGLRCEILEECRRVVKPDGRMMLMDYHFGPHPFPMGWVWKAMVVMMEMSAGRQHYANYRDFISRRGLQGLVGDLGLRVDKCFVTESGVAAIYLLKP